MTDREQEIALVLLVRAQQLFGGIIRDKPHEGGTWIANLDAFLTLPGVVELLTAIEASDKLGGPLGHLLDDLDAERELVRSTYQQVRWQAQDEFRPAIAAAQHALAVLKSAAPLHRGEMYTARAAASNAENELLKATALFGT